MTEIEPSWRERADRFLRTRSADDASARERGEQLVAAAEVSGADPQQLAEVLLHLGYMELVEGEGRSTIRRSLRALRLAVALGDPGLEARALAQRAMALHQLGDTVGAIAGIERLAPLVERHGPPDHLPMYLMNAGNFALAIHAHEVAVSFFERARAIARRTLPDSHPIHTLLAHNSAVAHLERGELTEALADFEACRERMARYRNQTRSRPALHAWQALARALGGDEAGARVDLGRAKLDSPERLDAVTALSAREAMARTLLALGSEADLQRALDVAQRGVGQASAEGRPAWESRLAEVGAEAAGKLGDAALEARLLRRSLTASRTLPERALGTALATMTHDDGTEVGFTEMPDPQALAVLAEMNRDLRRTAAGLRGEVQEQARRTQAVVHEIRGPITSILLSVEVAAAAAQTATERKWLAELDHKAREVRQLLDVSESTWAAENDMTRGDLVVAAIVAQLEDRASTAGVRVSVNQPCPTVLVDVPRADVERIVDNVVRRAIQVSPTGGEVTLDLARVAGQVRLTVDDDSSGIAAGPLGGAFDITRSGPALAVARGVARGAGGELTLEAAPSGGRRVVVLLPAV